MIQLSINNNNRQQNILVQQLHNVWYRSRVDDSLYLCNFKFDVGQGEDEKSFKGDNTNVIENKAHTRSMSPIHQVINPEQDEEQDKLEELHVQYDGWNVGCKYER